MNKLYKASIGLMAILLLIPMASAASVTRSLSSETVPPGGAVTVTLTVDVSGGADYYAVDDVYPQDWTVTNAGLGSTEHSGHWKYIEIEGAQNTQMTYQMTAPIEPGTYTFSGEYMFGGMSGAVPIEGTSSVTVASSTAVPQIALIAVVVVIAVVALIFLNKQRG
jgi:hypothetical protein